nr:MAG TPA: hypothetical protein [Caudoviricetes sp.]
MILWIGDTGTMKGKKDQKTDHKWGGGCGFL